MKEKKKLSLPAWIFIGMLAGIVAGLIFAFAGLGDFTTEWIKPIGTIYVNLLKFLVVPVVLFTMTCMTDGASLASYSSAPRSAEGSGVKLPLKMLTRIRPMTTASAVVIM